MKFLLSLLLLLPISLRSQVYYSRFTNPATTGIYSGVKNGLCALNVGLLVVPFVTIKDTVNIATASLKDSVHIDYAVGGLCQVILRTKLEGPGAAGTRGGFKLRFNGLLSALPTIKIHFYKNGALVTTQTFSGGLLYLLGGTGGLLCTASPIGYDEVGLELGVLSNINVLYSVDVFFGFGNAPPTGDCSATVLPITFAHSTASVVNNQPVLEWTATEQSYSEYDVERSYDGVLFQTIATIGGNALRGTYSYRYTDAGNKGSTAYYRIKATETATRSVNYSPVMRVQVQDIPGGPAVVLAPNPLQQRQCNLLLLHLPADRYRFVLTDLVGRAVVQHEQTISNTVQTTSFGIGNLPAGLYMLQVYTSRNTTAAATQRVLVP